MTKGNIIILGEGRTMKKFLLGVVFCLLLIGGVGQIVLSAEAGSEFDQVQITTDKLADNVYMLVGRGGNMGVSVGEDGVFIVDDQFAPLTDKIKKAIAAISDKQIRLVLNTHWHFDHTGGNENIGEAGSIIVAHENVRKRLSSEQFIEFFKKKVPATKKVGLPIITFTKDITFHLNNDTIHVFHVSYAHTDGDVIVYFQESNVIHMGDIYFSGMYPFIDLSSGGSVKGVIAAINQVLPLIDKKTGVIPGHGPRSNKAKLEIYRDMLATISKQISQLIKAGKTIEEIIADKPTQNFDSVFGKGIISADKFVEILFKDLSEEKK